ncbi:MAG TPA: class I SAM-dependent methyltransferase [Thermoanaerobaculia bacterium]|jgi:predicted O-methyltransferase YrrM|nr:class I SAM-dependent methyltransferase [Thermoanaerobaculia bacterium]
MDVVILGGRVLAYTYMRYSAYALAPEMNEVESDFLVDLIRKARLPGQHLEIGTGAGGSLCLMMTAFAEGERPHFVVVDPMHYFEHQYETVRLNLEFHGLDSSGVDMRICTSQRAFRSAQRLDERFDFILIDGKHSLRSVMLDLRWTRLLNPQGIVCLHDYSNKHPGVQNTVDQFLKRNSSRYRVIGYRESLIAIKKLDASTIGVEFAFVDWLYAALRSGLDYLRARVWRLGRHGKRRLEKTLAYLSNKTPEQMYAEHQIRRLSSGRRHQTLGANPEDDGLKDFNALIDLGLQRTHRVVDFGCGSLRLGHHLITFLDQGFYWGLDVTDHFFTAAIDCRYPDRAVLQGRASFAVISKASIAHAATTNPDLVIVAGVLQCVHPCRLDLLMAQLSALCCERTQILVTLLEADQDIQVGRYSFRHTAKSIMSAASSAGFRVTKLRSGLEPLLLRQIDSSEAVPGGERSTLFLLMKTPDAMSCGALCFDSLDVTAA